MAEMMLSCAVPPIPSWSLDPNVTNFSAFYGSERQGHAVNMGEAWGRGKLQLARESTLKQKKVRKEKKKKE